MLLPSRIKSSEIYRPPASLTSSSATFIYYVSYILSNNPYIEDKLTPIKRTKSHKNNLCYLN